MKKELILRMDFDVSQGFNYEKISDTMEEYGVSRENLISVSQSEKTVHIFYWSEYIKN